MKDASKQISRIGAKKSNRHFDVFLCRQQGPRDEQQDSAVVFQLNGRLLAVVCDGAGGHRGKFIHD